jgi:dextranase
MSRSPAFFVLISMYVMLEGITVAALPAGWISRDVGAVGAAGSALESGGTYTIQGSGWDIESTADAFQFAYIKVTGDCQITARVASQTNTNAWAKSGVMIRETLTDGSRYAMTAITPSNGVTFQTRSTIGGVTSGSITGGVTVPRWLRVKRAGNTFTSYRSTDGTNWTAIGSTSITMSTAVYIGLAVCSHADGTLGTAAFTSVTPVGSSVEIFDVNTDKSMYAPGSTPVIYVDLTNFTTAGFDGSVEVAVSHLGTSVETLTQAVSGLGAGQVVTKTFSWTPPSTDFCGYLLSVVMKDLSGNVISGGASAIDVSSDWRRFPRYGYLSQFGTGLDTANIMRQLKNYHITGLQYYDVAWKHHIPAPPSGWSTWPDIANRTHSRTTVTGFTSAARNYNIKSLIYDDWGAAYDDCYTDGSGVTLSMGRFSGTPASSGNQYAWGMPAGWATPQLRLMNNRDTGWQNYIFGRMQTAFTDLGFDGWHMDSLITNTMAYDSSGSQFNVYQYNPQFINNARAYWNSSTPLVQNQIDGSGLDWIGPAADVDFIYAELWTNYPNYSDLKRFFDESRSCSSKAVVYAAYLDRGKTSGFFNEPGVRLANAAIFASGASHIELGDGSEMLYNEYFPVNSVKMTDSLRGAMRTYYDFLVGYENLLRDETVSVNGSVSAAIGGVAASTSGSAGAVWVIAKKKPGCNIIHFVNLLNNTSTEWRDNLGTYPAPPTLNNLAVKMYYSGTISGGKLRYATPDSNFGAAAELSFTTGSDSGGNYIDFTVPQLQYWDMIWLEINGATIASTQIEAEKYDTYSGVGTESCSDTGGGLDIANVKNVTGDSYVGFGRINFSEGALSVSARVASAISNGTVEFRLDSPTGPLITTVSVGNTGGWQSWQTRTASVSGASGVHDLYAVFKVAASNLNWFKFALAANTAPAAPTGLTATTGDNSVSLDWNDNIEPDLASYTVYRSTTSGSGYASIASEVMTSAYTDNTAVNGTRYYYVVKAADNLSLASGNSNEATAVRYDGDLTFDGKVNMEDIAELGSGWQAEYNMDTLRQVANDWLSDAALQGTRESVQ